MSNCSRFMECSLTVDPELENIYVSKCCLKISSPIKVIKVEDFLKIKNVVGYLNSLSNEWPEDKSTRSFCKKFGDATECYSTNIQNGFETFAVELDTTCNLKCSFCYLKPERTLIMRKNNIIKAKNLYFQVLNKILESVTYHCVIRLTTHGEPFIWKNETLDFMRKAEQNNYIIRIECVTNGTQFIDKNFRTELLKFWKLKACVSINAFNSDLYKKRMGGDYFDRLLKVLPECYFVETFSYVICDEENIEDIKNNFKAFKELFPTKNVSFIAENENSKAEKLLVELNSII